jgi:hypothetical protein
MADCKKNSNLTCQENGESTSLLMQLFLAEKECLACFRAIEKKLDNNTKTLITELVKKVEYHTFCQMVQAYRNNNVAGFDYYWGRLDLLNDLTTETWRRISDRNGELFYLTDGDERHYRKGC